MGSRTLHLTNVSEWCSRHCKTKNTDGVTDADLQQSGLPGTKGNADYCRDLLRQLEQKKLGTIEPVGRKSIMFKPGAIKALNQLKNAAHTHSKNSKNTKNPKTLKTPKRKE